MGRDAGQGLARGLSASSKVIETAVEGSTRALTAQEMALERFHPLAMQYAAAKAQVTAETNQLRVALKAGEISQEQFNLAQIEGRTALKAQAIEMREAESAYLATMRTTDAATRAGNDMVRQQQAVTVSAGQSRAGMQQLSFQLNDVATMYAMGARPMQIFASQSGQVMQAVQMMTGGTSRLATFLMGPWGMALTGATIALAPFISRLMDTEDAADGARSALEELAQARESELSRQTLTGRAQGELNDLLAREVALRAEIQRASGGRTQGDGSPMFAYRQQQELEDVQAQIQRARQALFYADVQERHNPRDRVIEPRALPSLRGGGPAPESQAERDRAAAIEAAVRAELAFAEAAQRSLEAQTDIVRVEGVRRELGDAAAAAEEARLAYLRQNPLAVHQTAEELKRALGFTEALAEGEREHYENLIRSHDALEQIAASNAQRLVEQAKDQDAKRAEMAAEAKAQAAIKAQVDEQRRLQEEAVRDVADLYEDLFTGNTGKIWGRFKDQGLQIISELAAQWTLALLSGQTAGALLGGGGGGFGGGAQGKLGLLSSAAGLFAGNPATKPGVAAQGGIGDLSGLIGLMGGGGGTGGAAQAATMLAAVPGLGQAMAVVALQQGIGEGIEKVTGLRFDMLGGLFGGLVGGFAVGALKGAVKGSATIGAQGSNLGVVDSFGKQKFQDRAIGNAGGVIDTLEQIAAGLGVDLNAGSGSVSIGIRNGQYRVDPTGGGALKPGQGAIDFGKDEQAAIEYAIRNLIEDGVLGPISQASRNILTRGGDLQDAIEKAVMIESIPKLLRQRLDPLGAALEDIDERFGKLAEALKEGGASAEQIAQARKLWQLEREDTLRQIGDASQGLKDFLQSLNAGSTSPLSLREQQTEAEAALAPYVAAIEEARAAQAEVERLRSGGGSAAEIAAAEEAARTAAAGVDQGGFQQAAQLVLGVSRQINASSGNFFADFDRIRSLTSGAIGAIDGAVATPGAGKDPFSELTALHTGDISAQMHDQTRLLNIIASSVTGLPAGNDNGTWLQQSRGFSSDR